MPYSINTVTDTEHFVLTEGTSGKKQGPILKESMPLKDSTNLHQKMTTTNNTSNTTLFEKGGPTNGLVEVSLLESIAQKGAGPKGKKPIVRRKNSGGKGKENKEMVVSSGRKRQLETEPQSVDIQTYSRNHIDAIVFKDSDTPPWRAFACTKWKQQFPKARVTHCRTRASDHAPILLQIEPQDNKQLKLNRRFRFEAMWLKHEGCENIIKDSWNFSSNGHTRKAIHSTLIQCKTRLINWNKICVGNITTKVKKLRDKLHEVRIQPRDAYAIHEENRLRTELEDLLDKEEMLWRQRGKAQWIREGDKNTAFFHARATARKHNNQIIRLKNDDGEWCETQEEINKLATTSPHCSYTWRSIIAAKEVLLQGVRWQVGNGNTIKVWKDPWIPIDGCFYLFGGEQSELNTLKVRDLLIPSSHEWNVDLIKRKFCTEEASIILGIPLPRHNREDQLVWHFTRSGRYSVKTGYHLARRHLYLKTEESRGGGSSSKSKSSWLFIWSSNVPEKIKITVWRLATNALPLRQNLTRKKITTDTSCPLCDHGEESAIHRVIDCDFARQCWALSNIPHSAWNHKQSDVETWLRILHHNLDYNQWRLAMIILWSMWHQRNLKNIGDRHSNPLEVIRFSCTYIQAIDTQCLNYVYQPHQTTDQEWQPPSSNSVKINFDATVSPSKTCGGLGIVARDHNGMSLGWRRRVIHGQVHPTTAEAMAAREAVSFALENGWRSIVVEGDCLAVITGISEADDKFSVESPIYHDIRVLLGDFQSYTLRHVRRNANSVAHRIATFCDLDCNGISLPF
ncbi:hypothetical protein DH2020_035901 [Rehmannia glutinosa]|uniref:RNase H type-1 domain-containing protein n=1 Tax=Rehmannia glutinosa TaxID=99300 RepID=A0ABR0V534_REHGL